MEKILVKTSVKSGMITQRLGGKRALYIAEVIHEVVEILRVSGAKGSLASLARTCWAFYDCAMDALWSTQLGFANLVPLLPEDLWKLVWMSYVKDLKIAHHLRSIEVTDLQRFEHYARRVRHLEEPFTHDHIPFTTLSSQFFQALTPFYSNTGIFPRLRTLDIGWRLLFDHSPCAWHLFSGSIELKSFHLRTLSPPSELAFLLGIVELSSALQELQLDLTGNVAAMTILPKTLRALPRLHTVVLATNCTPFPTEVLVAMSALPGLVDLTLLAEAPEFVLPPLSTSLVFSTMRNLSLFGRDLPSCASLLQNVSLPQLERFATSFLNISNRSLNSHLDALSRSCDASYLLQSVSISDQEPEARPFSPTHRALPTEAITMNALRHLLPFRQLRMLLIETVCAFKLTNTDISDMAQAWPELLALALVKCSDSDAPAPPYPTDVTLAGLIPLARYCPNLGDIRIGLDGSQLEVLDEQGPDDIIPNLSAKYFAPSPSLCGDPAKVAAFLSCLFPCLEELYVDIEDYAPSAWSDAEKWAEVEELVTSVGCCDGGDLQNGAAPC
ncbi:hypothetical protein L226DRAFT_584668, partial [Lentinus tigrinus ALCF2SS1-7]|uniref:F-box domain-containing protein n=1 Tax=Lentinus tigrinus ALCF2SS1-6 TaxID=1328759 RepID=A0A5C2S6L5_9APHY